MSLRSESNSLSYSLTRSRVEAQELTSTTEERSSLGPKAWGPGSLVETNRLIQTNEILHSNFKKSRSLWFLLANSHFKRIPDLGILRDSDLAKLEIYFDEWRAGQRKKFVHLVRGQEHLFIKQYSRFDPDYRSMLRQKLAKLNGISWNMKIELTIDPKRMMRYADGFFLLNKGWNRLLSWLRRRFGEGFDHFHVMEITKLGRGHLHVLLSGVDWIDQKELSELWDSYGCGPVVYLKRVDSGNKIVMSSYVLKYVNKTLNQEDKRFASVLFASNKRLFSMSKDCQGIVNGGKAPREKQGFKYERSVFQGHLREFCKEKGIEFDPVMRIQVEISDFYQFPNLFDADVEGYTYLQDPGGEAA